MGVPTRCGGPTNDPRRPRGFPRTGATIEMQPLEQVGELVVHDREEGRGENPKGGHAWFWGTDEKESGMAAFSLLSPHELAPAGRFRRGAGRRGGRAHA